MKIKGITDKISRWFALKILCVMKLCGCLCADFKTFFCYLDWLGLVI